MPPKKKPLAPPSLPGPKRPPKNAATKKKKNVNARVVSVYDAGTSRRTIRDLNRQTHDAWISFEE